MTVPPVHIAVVIPVWRQADLADEAIASVLAQHGGTDWHIIIVNDGCPDATTQVALESWAESDPARITLITTGNRGLSAARNIGIEIALQRPNIEAVFFLDADNRLDPGAMILFRQLLAQHEQAGWFYPNFDMFGQDGPQSNGGTWSLARMAVSNICDAGSLVRRQVFERGLRFDETLNGGFEDWNFFLSAAQHGFVGHAVAHSFFRYRKRGHSMLRLAQDNRANLMQDVRSRHRWLFGSRELAQVYAREFPRFAFVQADGSAVFGQSDTDDAVSFDAVAQRWFAQASDPFCTPIPQTWVFAAPGALAQLQRHKRCASVLLQLEHSVANGEIGTVHFTDADQTDLRAVTRHTDRDWQNTARAAIIALPHAHIAAALAGTDLLASIGRLMKGVVAPYVFTAPGLYGTPELAAGTAMDFLARLAESHYNSAMVSATAPWRKPAKIVSLSDLPDQICKLNLGGLHLPENLPEQPKIGFVLPLLRFGGVEKCVVALASALRAKGVAPYLFLYGDSAAQPDEWLIAPFVQVHQISRRDLRDWSGDKYMGTADGRAPSDWLAGRLFGPLSAMDAVINAGCGPLNAVLGALRQFGVRTAVWEHVIDETPLGRATGTPFVALSNAAACDRILTCSQGLADWFAGMGIARDRLLALPNGPGFPGERVIRAPRPAEQPLRVGFMGRFDRQKGVDRFCQIVAALGGGAFEFSVIGAPVMADSDIDLPPHIVRYPVAQSPAQLSAAYARLDVLLMPSRAEGLPLAILEAQRAGVVPVVTDVGAVREAIAHGQNGWLLPPDSVVPAATGALLQLARDRDLLHRLAMGWAGQDQWGENAARLLASLGIAPLA